MIEAANNNSHCTDVVAKELFKLTEERLNALDEAGGTHTLGLRHYKAA